jgi:hypothetical protein
MSIVKLAARAQGPNIPIRLGNFAACINDDIDANNRSITFSVTIT